MKDHTDCKRQFTQLSRAWYASANLPEGDNVEIVTIGFYRPDGDTTGEFQVSWEPLGGRLVPQLSAFDDGWSALFMFGDLLESMADIDDQNISPAEFCKMLVALGIEDVTKTSNVSDTETLNQVATQISELASSLDSNVILEDAKSEAVLDKAIEHLDAAVLLINGSEHSMEKTL